ncbi:protein ROOT PRIMORDIUM DEFECTIVE 1 [Ananas comosus]|uniref:Protein ROOT PRIMORDIUM DEFECTIVE 1 n=1 Tax=Ananas comosus TaxID=4615 RepID=A0A6P5GR96_ANACO|nr:protein ROOT PRIMORDIUM DEFECTIVE 1 [Ananas comosus]XP_020111161.1 protein ROOT PRIMORDIUM DEFECTIVE 1 [Ananas comosus]XP_020111162.1 protein ROOT PRIMORDIUM DEFECTIVE 1 [Ananas comosus]
MIMRRQQMALRRAWRQRPFMAEQRAFLVNVRLKWVKDRALDSVVARERYLRPAHHLLDLISSDPRARIPLRDLSRLASPKLPFDALAFLRRYPTLFRESAAAAGFSLTDAASALRNRELDLLRDAEADLVERLRRLLMLTAPRSLPLHTVDLLRWDLGLPRDYRASLLPRHPDLFGLVRPPGDERVWIRLLSWDQTLAVSELQKSSAVQIGGEGLALAFPVSFTRGFGLSKKCAAWLKEWQALPYTSPYADASALDPRTDVSEKRIVGVFHELLHLTVGKKTERRNVSNMRKLLGMPHKFTKVFDRHPGIFYLSQKLATQTVVLREAYGGGGGGGSGNGGRQLLVKLKHPLAAIREEYTALMRGALPVRRRRGASHPSEEEEEEDDDDDDADAGGDDGSDGYET